MKKITLLIGLFLLSACTIKASFIPERGYLNDAAVGTPYYSQINTFGGLALSHDIYGRQVIMGDIYPDNIGLHIQYCDEREINNCLQIRGVPRKSGIAKVRVRGILAGGLFFKGSEFDKTYIITIKDSKDLPST